MCFGVIQKVFVHGNPLKLFAFNMIFSYAYTYWNNDGLTETGGLPW